MSEYALCALLLISSWLVIAAGVWTWCWVSKIAKRKRQQAYREAYHQHIGRHYAQRPPRVYKIRQNR